MNLTLDTSVVRNPNSVFTDMDGDTVIMSIEQGNYYGMSDVGTLVWKMLEQPKSIREIVQAVRMEYTVDESTCQNDLFEFIEDLIKNGLVTFA